MIDLEEFKKDAMRTESRIDDITTNTINLQMALLMFIMSGNMLDKIKKNVFYGKVIDQQAWDSNIAHIQEALTTLSTGIYAPLAQNIQVNVNPRIFHGILGIATESTELCEALMQVLVTHQPFDNINLQEEIGDLAWYQAVLVDAIDADLEKILHAVVAKLKARYPNKFTTAEAHNRDLATERQVLEERLNTVYEFYHDK